MIQHKHGSGPTKSRSTQEPKPVTPPERHSGEGSASVLETLQKLEKKRLAKPPDRPGTDEDPRS